MMSSRRSRDIARPCRQLPGPPRGLPAAVWTDAGVTVALTGAGRVVVVTAGLTRGQLVRQAAGIRGVGTGIWGFVVLTVELQLTEYLQL